MATFGSIGIIVLGAVLVEKRCREAGNTDGALAAKRFGRYFLVGAGGMVAYEWMHGLLTLLLF
ncbi:hypothetical protein ACFSL6_24005 [Paenibacillus thailandensis]|uniref:Uncharacterized protein n=1 Tax=Paenibacillus thailandensis TaxID=393250 RepID=A0ABW5R2L9_9BACL